MSRKQGGLYMKKEQKALVIIYANAIVYSINDDAKRDAIIALRAICEFAGLNEYKICQFVKDRAYCSALNEVADMTDEQFMDHFKD